MLLKESKEYQVNGHVRVTGQIWLEVNFDFPLFFSLLIYDNEYQNKKIKINLKSNLTCNMSYIICKM